MKCYKKKLWICLKTGEICSWFNSGFIVLVHSIVNLISYLEHFLYILSQNFCFIIWGLLYQVPTETLFQMHLTTIHFREKIKKRINPPYRYQPHLPLLDRIICELLDWPSSGPRACTSPSSWPSSWSSGWASSFPSSFQCSWPSS